MGAPVFNTRFVGQGTRQPKPAMCNQQGGLSSAYETGKHVYGVASALYGAYQTGKAWYPAIRAGLQGLRYL